MSVKPQGNVDVTFGGNWQNIKNPTLTQRAQKYGVFDFDMQMNINLLAQIGDKLKLNISNNTSTKASYTPTDCDPTVSASIADRRADVHSTTCSASPPATACRIHAVNR